MNTEAFEIVGITIPSLRVFHIGEEITVLHREPDQPWEKANSLITFMAPTDYLTHEIAAAVNRACKDIDWEVGFDTVQSHQAYRRAAMNIPNFLMGE